MNFWIWNSVMKRDLYDPLALLLYIMGGKSAVHAAEHAVESLAREVIDLL